MNDIIFCKNHRVYQKSLLTDNLILIYRDPNDVFREFFGGIDPFEEMMDRKFYYCIK